MRFGLKVLRKTRIRLRASMRKKAQCRTTDTGLWGLVAKNIPAVFLLRRRLLTLIICHLIKVHIPIDLRAIGIDHTDIR